MIRLWCQSRKGKEERIEDEKSPAGVELSTPQSRAKCSTTALQPQGNLLHVALQFHWGRTCRPGWWPRRGRAREARAATWLRSLEPMTAGRGSPRESSSRTSRRSSKSWRRWCRGWSSRRAEAGGKENLWWVLAVTIKFPWVVWVFRVSATVLQCCCEPCRWSDPSIATSTRTA